MAGILSIVGTPIGNLADLSPRARETLASVVLVAAEDTRRTGRLLAGIGVQVPMLSVFEANESSRIPKILEVLATGDVALVSDGGMPLVSDPGYRLVKAVADAGIEVRVVPGPSAAIAALTVSGLPTDRFVFEGFLPRKTGERARRLTALATDPRTIVCFESPKRVAATLREVAGIFGADRPVAVCRELTKLHEQVVRGPVAEVARSIGEPKGEVVVVLAGAPPSEGDLAAAVEAARALMAGGAKPRQAATQAAATLGVSANEVYDAIATPAGGR